MENLDFKQEQGLTEAGITGVVEPYLPIQWRKKSKHKPFTKAKRKKQGKKPKYLKNDKGN